MLKLTTAYLTKMNGNLRRLIKHHYLFNKHRLFNLDFPQWIPWDMQVFVKQMSMNLQKPSGFILFPQNFCICGNCYF